MPSQSTELSLTRIKIPLLRTGQPADEIIVQAIKKQRLRIRNGDIIAVPSKIISLSQSRIVKFAEIKPSRQASALARKWKIRSELAQVVVDEADAILGGVKGFMLTLKEGMLTANAGVDAKNSPSNTVILWPTNLKHSVRKLKYTLERQLGCRIGTIIVDSRVTPLRLGTTGLAIAWSGFNPIHDDRGKLDLYGRRIIFTQTNIADDLAAAAHLLMGEAREQVGAVLIHNPPIRLSKNDRAIDVRLSPDRCLIANNLRKLD